MEQTAEKLSKCPVCQEGEFKCEQVVLDHFLTKEEFSIVSCSACGFRFVNPRPSFNSIGDYYNSEAYISHSNTSKGIVNRVYGWVKAYSLNKKYKMIAALQPTGRILDIGCGPGDLLSVFKKRGWETRGVELNESARNIASSEKGLLVDDFDALFSLPEQHFNVITMWHVLEHIHDLRAVVDQVSRLLKQNGTLIVAVPNRLSYDANVYGEYWAAYDVPRHIYHFRQKDIQSLFGKAGFNVAEILPMKFDSYYVSLLSEKYKHGQQNYLSAIANGWTSNRKAKQSGEYSSLIYVINKASA